MIKSVLSLWLNDFFFFFVLGFGLSSIVRTRRHTSREVSGIGEISILVSEKKEKLKFIKTFWAPWWPPEQIGPNWVQNSKAHFFRQTEIVN